MSSLLSAPRLIYGSMRLQISAERDASYWISLLRQIHAIGIRTIHLSSEYESYRDVVLVLRVLRNEGISFNHVVKLAEPHFGATAFNSDAFLHKLSAYQEALGKNSIQTIQWLWRGDMNNEPDRMNGVLRDAEKIGKAVSALKRDGVVEQLVCFPYTTGFGEIALREQWCDGLAVYLNPIENDFLPLCRQADSIGKQIIAIRPYAASKALAAGHGPEYCLDWVAKQPAVQGIVLTFSSICHFPVYTRPGNR